MSLDCVKKIITISTADANLKTLAFDNSQAGKWKQFYVHLRSLADR